MAIRRDPNGQQHGVKAATANPVAPTRVVVRQPENLIKETAIRPLERQSNDKRESTRLYGAPIHNPGEQGVAQNKAMNDPVVGWLVVVFGPGRGNALPLGYGLNGIGRGPRARVRLDYGDLEISRDQHAVISYDPKGRRFYLQHGGGTNLTYLNQQPVLLPSELKGDEIIVLGQTRLRFVPFCGANFDWQDVEKRE